jgi:2-keto-4-pentenoate hydratase/2-oxohepta-3-ene-1,7-dioic acid hydratase in catechol pathway
VKLITAIVDGQRFVGRLTGESGCSIIEHNSGELPLLMEQVIASPKHLNRLESLADLRAFDLDQVLLDAPISGMEKLICIGKNYAEHAKEMGGQPPEIPVVFNKFPSSITAPNGEIRLPGISQQVDFEAELVVVIGRQGKNIDRDRAIEHVFGYCCGNDITARDWQKGKPGGQWLLGKTCDTFAPLGPAIVTRDEIPDVAKLSIETRLNGKVMQRSNTGQLIFSIEFLISHISQFVTLRPGDLIFTGTPPGVGAGRIPPVFLKPGDQLEVEIEGLGTLRNHVVADS